RERMLARGQIHGAERERTRALHPGSITVHRVAQRHTVEQKLYRPVIRSQRVVGQNFIAAALRYVEIACDGCAFAPGLEEQMVATAPLGAGPVHSLALDTSAHSP